MAQWLSARLPPMWPGFDSRTRHHTCMWVEFVVGSRPCSEGFSPGFSGFPSSTKTNISKFQFEVECMVTFQRVPRALWCSVGKQTTFTFVCLVLQVIR